MASRELGPRGGPLRVADVWSLQWAAVPASWRTPSYRLDQAPASEVFTRNANYLRSDKAYSFAPAGPERLGEEVAWWVWVCWAEGHRKIEPAMLAWWRRAVEALVPAGAAVTSLAQLDPAAVVRQASLLFQRRHGRLPSPGNRRNLSSLAEHVHLMVSTRTGAAPWWSHDVWDLRIDPRIPRREHEPRHDIPLRLVAVDPAWLRDGLRFWLRTALTTQMLTWSTAVTRARTVGAHWGRFAAAQAITDPLVADDPAQLRAVFLDFLATLRAPGTLTGKAMSAQSVAAVQSHVQSFYAFMHDHAAEAAAATGNPRWADAGATHTRLWAPAYRGRVRGNVRELTWIATADLRRMLGYLDVLGAASTERVVVTADDGSIAVLAGHGDPQAMRAWLLQAMTGRRASEILLLDYEPLTAIPGREAANDPGDGQFVARLRYQQTKVDGVEPTILVEAPVVRVIREQQQWLREQFPDLAPRYRFAGLRHNHRGDQPRTYSSYEAALRRLDTVHGLLDSAGAPLQFTQTHRLRHTRATELLNDGVPFHVVQRYLGHKSPEMTARYAATLAATAEAEFLRHKKIGANGSAIEISPRDVYDMTQLGKRTDRILPNGVCLLPPVKTCDKGNACLSCGHFATDATHLGELVSQRAATADLLERRRSEFQARTGRTLDDGNVWVLGRVTEIASLDAIVASLSEQDFPSAPVCGGAQRPALLQIQTRGAHATLLESSEAQGAG